MSQIKYYIAGSPGAAYRIGPFSMLSAAESVLNIVKKHGINLMQSDVWNLYSEERKVQIQNVLRITSDIKNLAVYEHRYGKRTKKI